MHDLALWHLCTKGRITGRTDQMVRFPAAFHRGTLRVSTGLTTSCACRNGCAPRCQQTQPPGTQRCIWPGSISGGLGICQCNLSKARGERRDEGTKGRRDGGTKARRHGGTKGQRHGGREARRHEGTAKTRIAPSGIRTFSFARPCGASGRRSAAPRACRFSRVRRET